MSVYRVLRRQRGRDVARQGRGQQRARQHCRAQVQEEVYRQRIKGTRYDQGYWRVAVVLYGRLGDDEERLVFRAAPEGPEEGGVDFFNSTELRHVFSESDVPMAMGAEGQTCTWRLPRKAEAEGRSWFR